MYFSGMFLKLNSRTEQSVKTTQTWCWSRGQSGQYYYPRLYHPLNQPPPFPLRLPLQFDRIQTNTEVYQGDIITLFVYIPPFSLDCLFNFTSSIQTNTEVYQSDIITLLVNFLFSSKIVASEYKQTRRWSAAVQFGIIIPFVNLHLFLLDCFFNFRIQTNTEVIRSYLLKWHYHPLCQPLFFSNLVLTTSYS